MKSQKIIIPVARVVRKNWYGEKKFSSHLVNKAEIGPFFLDFYRKCNIKFLEFFMEHFLGQFVTLIYEEEF